MFEQAGQSLAQLDSSMMRGQALAQLALDLSLKQARLEFSSSSV